MFRSCLGIWDRKDEPVTPAKGTTTVLGMYVRLVNRIEERDEGQGLVEYALIIALIATLLIASLTTFKTSIATAFTAISVGL